MSVYEDYDGLERPNRRPVSPPPKPRQNRTAWLILILLYMSGCSYWGWQVFLRPESDPSPVITAETETSLADDGAARSPGETTLMTATDLAPAGPPILPSSAPISPSSKPASVRTQRPKRNGRPLDKMEAETGLIYETEQASPASIPGPQHADRGALSPRMEASDPNERVDVDYANDPTIDQRDIPPASESARGVVLEQTEVERLPDPETVPAPQPKASPPPILEAEPEPDLPPFGQEPETVVLSESLPPVEEIILAPPPPEPTLPEVDIVVDSHPPIEPPLDRYPPTQPVIYVEPAPVIVVPPPYQPVFDYDGPFVVQIASFANVEAACSVWEDLRFEHPRLFGDAETIVRPHRTSSGRTLHRLRVGAFATRRDAIDWCVAYKELGGDCFVTRR